jgi:hypothetical protein
MELSMWTTGELLAAEFSKMRTERKPGFSVQQHKAIAPELKQMQRGWVHLQNEVENAYPRKEDVVRRVLGDIAKAVAGLAAIRNSLDSIMLADFPDIDYRGIYYGSLDDDGSRGTELVTPKFSEGRTGRKPGLPLQRIQGIRADLYRQRQYLASLFVEAGNVYPHSEAHVKKALNGIDKTTYNLDVARTHLETLMMLDFPNDDLRDLAAE